MDLCLKGSQINLATRQQTKPKYSFMNSRSLTVLHNTAPHFRPRSANFIQQRSRSSPFLGRPQSADPNLSRRLSLYFNDKDLKHSKQRNISSTNVLKSLLDEPIKRSWLCRSAGNSSIDEQSDLSQKSLSSAEGEHLERFLSAMPSLPRPPTNTAAGTHPDKSLGYATRHSGWPHTGQGLSKAALLQKIAKPDLPGRVSFSKANMQNDLDSSDCDNDKQELGHGSSISAPGPQLPPASFSCNNNKLEPADALSGQKKSVHFGAPAAGASDREVLAETYEYPKCPSENCTCSTRSSSTASTHEAGQDAKCNCTASSCRLDDNADRLQLQPSSPTSELNVILEYKQAIGATLDNKAPKNSPEQRTPKYAQLEAINNMELPSYMGKYAGAHSKDAKQNNLSEAKSLGGSSGAPYVSASQHQRSFAAENNFLPQMREEQRDYGNGSSDTVISNYLKVASTPALVAKKKENIKPVSADHKSKPLVKSLPASAKTLKKAVSVGNLREERKLSEYNLDKVDSWMSMQQHEQAQLEALKCKESLEELDNDSNSQMSLKSNEDSKDSTYDEIVSVIKEIEEDKKQDNFAERLPSELNLKLESRCETADSITQTSNGITESGDKYKDILAYLNNVESSCDKTLMETRRSLPESSRSEVEFIVEPDVTDEVPKLSELLMLPNHQLARRVIGLSLRANELANAIHLSKEHVVQLRTDKQKTLRAERAANAGKMRDQKKHYEDVVKRHQGFIEQLLKDKGSLCEKVAALTRRLESQNQAWEHRLETELTRSKETTLAGEKIRRERWVRENTKKIKELTVKGLEAEINKMTCDHQREVTELKRTHQLQLLDALEEARLKHEQIEHSIRETCAQDRETIIEKERMAIRERFERQLEEEQKSQAEQRQKLCEEFAMERERLQLELRQKENDYLAKRQEMQRDSENELEQAKFELQEKMAKQEEKYQNRINTVEKQYMTDFELWKTEYENSCKLAQAEKENAIRQHYRLERDRQLDELVVRMEADALHSNEEYEQKLQRIKDKYEKDLTVAENVEKSLREKYAETRGKLAEADAQVRNCQAEVQQLQLELGHSKKMCGDIISERDRLRENANADIQNELGVLSERHKLEMEQLQKRVHQTIQRQEETIEVLKTENDNLRQQCLKLNAVIRQQRKDYCVK